MNISWKTSVNITALSLLWVLIPLMRWILLWMLSRIVPQWILKQETKLMWGVINIFEETLMVLKLLALWSPVVWCFFFWKTYKTLCSPPTCLIYTPLVSHMCRTVFFVHIEKLSMLLSELFKFLFMSGVDLIFCYPVYYIHSLKFFFCVYNVFAKKSSFGKSSFE